MVSIMCSAFSGLKGRISLTLELAECLDAKIRSWANLKGSCSRSFVATQDKPLHVSVCVYVCVCLCVCVCVIE